MKISPTHSLVLVCVLSAATVFCSSASAALFLDFDGVDGDSQDAGHLNWIDILTVNWGISVAAQVSSGGGQTTSKPIFSDLSWTQNQDRSFPSLFSNISSGKPIKSATVDFTTDSSTKSRVFFQLDFDNVILTSLNLSSDGSGLPFISGSFAYEKVQVTYTPQDQSGKELSPISASYDLVTAKGDAAAVAGLFAQGLSGPEVSAVPVPAGIWLLGPLLPLLMKRRKIFRG